MEEIRASLDRYINHKIPTGGFLRAILENNLKEACARADNINRHRLFEIVSYCYNDIPSGSWGSPEKVEAWLAQPKTNKSEI